MPAAKIQIPTETLDQLSAPLFRDHMLVPSGTVFLYGLITQPMADHLAKCLHLLGLAEQPITIYLNSEGGYINAGFGMYDLIRATENHVTIVGYGQVCSAAALVLQAADLRVLAPNTEVMIHPGHTQPGEDLVANLERTVKASAQLRDKMYGIFADRMGMTLKEMHQRHTLDSFFSARAAVRAGLADKVL